MRMDPAVFASLHYLPHPVSSSNDHYKLFEVYGEREASTEKYRPSLQQKKRKASTFSASSAHRGGGGAVRFS